MAAAALPEVPPAPGAGGRQPLPAVASRGPLGRERGRRRRHPPRPAPTVSGGRGGPCPSPTTSKTATADPILSELIRAHGATHAQVRATGDARNVEIVAIDTIHGPRTSRLATGAPAGAPRRRAPPSGRRRGPRARTPPSPSSTTTTRASSTTTTTLKPKPKVPQPDIVTRAEWGADESIRKNDQKYAPITKLFVHHTVTSPDGPDPDPAATVRAIYAYHVQGNGWDDIGYNFLVDAQGRVYEGRWARDYAAGEKPTGEDLNENGVVGAHVLNHNAGSAGVAMLGDFTDGEPTDDGPGGPGQAHGLEGRPPRHRRDWPRDPVHQQ